MSVIYLHLLMNQTKKKEAFPPPFFFIKRCSVFLFVTERCSIFDTLIKLFNMFISNPFQRNKKNICSELVRVIIFFNQK